jgi:hypothetical protein
VFTPQVTQEDIMSELGFTQTDTGYQATDAQVQWWADRDTCPACGTPCSPGGVVDGVNYYQHQHNGGLELGPAEVIEWTRRRWIATDGR